MSGQVDFSAATILNPSSLAGLLARSFVNVTLANLQAKGAVLTATFNVGSVLPANARVLGSDVIITQAFAATGLGTALISIEATADSAGSLVVGASGLTTGTKAPPGTNPYMSRGGQQITCTVTTTVANLNALTAGAFTATILYAVVA